MFETLRDRIAGGLEIFAQRLTTDPRWPSQARVPRARTISSIVVTPDTAITIPAVWACLRYLSQTVAVLPWHVMQEDDDGAEIALKHPIDYLLSKRPSPEWSSLQFRETLTHWALRWGNGYAEIEPDKAGRPFAMWPIHPERVLVCRATAPELDAYGDPIKVGDLYYQVTQGPNFGGATICLRMQRVFHIRGFGEGPVGVNVINYAAESLGWVKAAQLFGASYFGNGGNVGTVVMNKKPLKPEGLERQRQEFSSMYKGPRNSHKTAHIDNDADVKTIGSNAKESQLVEANQMLVADVCRWFGVPPHKVMDLSRATFSNIEHQAIEVVVDSVSPWVKRFEDEADFKLFGPQNRQGFYSKINMRALMRGDTASRIAYYDGMTKVGAFSPNRILQLEDENTIGPAGDIHTMQSQNVTLEAIAAATVPPASGAGTPADNPDPEGAATDPADPAVEPSDANDPEGDSAVTDMLDELDAIMGMTVDG